MALYSYDITAFGLIMPAAGLKSGHYCLNLGVMPPAGAAQGP